MSVVLGFNVPENPESGAKNKKLRQVTGPLNPGTPDVFE